MIALLLIFIPICTGIISLFLNGSNAKWIGMIGAIATLTISLIGTYTTDTDLLSFDSNWMPDLGSRITLQLDGMSSMLCLLSAIALPLIFSATWKQTESAQKNYHGLMLLTQAGLMGVFVSMDCLLFYFFWELALIPAYFLCSFAGGEKRIKIIFKFFVYTFLGSLLLLIGILTIYFKSGDHSFAWESLKQVKLSNTEQSFVFWMFFIAFAIKMPIFPFHTWQPDTYEQAPTGVTMLLSGVMVKMGLFAVIRWLLPLTPDASIYFSNAIIIISIVGMIYASLIAIKQDDIKRLIAYSSIAHIGLMCAAIFSHQSSGMQGVMIQLFNHGVNVIGLWIVAYAIEQSTGTRKMSELGGLAKKAPTLAILFVIMALANIAIPLTNAFAGEFLMFNGLFRYNVWIAALAGVSIILAAVYTLWMVQNIFYGEEKPATSLVSDAGLEIKLPLLIIAAVILLFGFYPQPMIDFTADTVTNLFTTVTAKQ